MTNLSLCWRSIAGGISRHFGRSFHRPDCEPGIQQTEIQLSSRVAYISINSYIINLARISKIVSLLLVGTCFLVPACRESKDSKTSMVNQHKEIKTLLDKAQASDDPIKAFQMALPEIQRYAVVDSAWISGLTIYVRYRDGGIVSWMINPQDLPQNREKRK